MCSEFRMFVKWKVSKVVRSYNNIIIMEVNNKRADRSISSQVTSLYFITQADTGGGVPNQRTHLLHPE